MDREPDMALDYCFWLSGSQKNLSGNFFKVDSIAEIPSKFGTRHALLKIIRVLFGTEY